MTVHDIKFKKITGKKDSKFIEILFNFYFAICPPCVIFAKVMKKANQIKQEGLPQAWREDISNAINILNQGGVILYPTDTIWGLGCDASNDKAVERIFKIKKRIDSKAMISLVDSPAKVQGLVKNMPDVAWDLIEVTTRPLTIIYDEVNFISPLLQAEDGSAAIRVTEEDFSRELCMRFRRPIVSTSANISGNNSPQCFADIDKEICDAVDYICTSRREEDNPAASSIIKLKSNGEIIIIRE